MAGSHRGFSRVLADREAELTDAWFMVLFDKTRLATYDIAGVSGDDLDSFRKPFVIPLIRLLAHYLSTSEARIRSCYLDELLRYAPHRAAPEVRVRYFNEVLPQLETHALGLLPESEREPMAAVLREIHSSLLTPPSGKALTLVAFGDCLMNEIRVFLAARASDAGVPLDMRGYYFSARMGAGIAVENVIEAIEQNKADVASFSFLSYDGLPMYSALLRDAERLSAVDCEERVVQLISYIRKFINTLRENTEIPFLIHNASGLPLTRFRRRLPFLSPLSPKRQRVVESLNKAMEELTANTVNCLLIDEYAVSRKHGLRYCAENIAPHSVSAGAFFHTQNFGDVLSIEYRERLRAFRLLRKTKVLLLDFDNTLWKGVMADGDVEHYLDRQKLLKQLQQAGCVLVAVSKNDPANIRWDEIHLQPDDFALMHINWDLKCQSIEKTASLLDLGLDSLVFVDDNPVERELVTQQLPKVTALDALDPFTWKALEMMLDFPNTRETEESRMRTAMYREQAQRRESLTRPLDYGAMMSSLGLKVRFGKAGNSDLDRLSELVQRTNQFNTTTIRYSRSQLQGFLTDPAYRVYVADLQDRFGQLGLVVAAIVKRQGDEVVFDSFVMSCRAMGFELESLVMSLVMDSERDAKTFTGRFIATDRNTPAADLYSRTGFARTSDTEWSLGEADARTPAPAWFEVMPR